MTSRPARSPLLGRAVAAALAAGLVLALVLRAEGDGPARGAVPRTTSAASFVDAPVPARPRLARRSAAMVRSSILPYVRTANLAGSEHWGIPVATARATDPVRRVTLFRWGFGPKRTVRFRIPDAAQPSQGSDHHLAVIDGDRELDLWAARRVGGGDLKAGAAVVVPRDAGGIAGAVAGTAAGFTLTAGIVRADELAAGRIDHALVFTVPRVHPSYVAPAVHTDGRARNRDALPMGTRIQLDPAADLSGLPRTQRVVARALQVYGAYLVDSSGSLAVRAEAPATGAGAWARAGLADLSLGAIPWSRVRVLAP